LSGGIAPLILILALDRCEWSDCLHWPLYCQQKAAIGIWVGTGAGLDVLEKSSLATAKILTADLPAYIPLTVLTVLPHGDMKIIQMYLLIK